jgi:hypothetical protein
MAYTLAPFNPSTPYQNQVATELNLANNNFTILGQAFYNNNPSSNPVLRASYIGSSAPSNPVAGTTWLDTSTNPPMLKVYDGSTWQYTAPLNQSGILDLSATYVKSNVYTFRRVDLTNASSDYTLQVGEEAYIKWDTSGSTSCNLHIATVEGLYLMIVIAPFQQSNDIYTSFYPNNTSYSNAFVYSNIASADGGSVGSAKNTLSNMSLSQITSGGISECYFSTYTKAKFNIGYEKNSRNSQGGSIYLFGNQWQDTTTTWTSLGTITTSNANGVIYILVRRLA